MTTQHERWSAKAERRLIWAASAEAAAAELDATMNRDWAFLTQPGHIPARAAQIARSDRAMHLRQKAAAHRAKAASLQKLAQRRAGDAERERQDIRDASRLKVGDAARSVHYGPCVVVKVNAKSYRIRLPTGFETNQDKAYVK